MRTSTWVRKTSINSITCYVFAGDVATVETLFLILRCINQGVHKLNPEVVLRAAPAWVNLQPDLENRAKYLIFLGFTEKSRFSVDNFVDIWGGAA